MRHRQPAPDDRLAALRLVHREVDALAQQPAEGSLHAVLAHESLEISVLAAGVMQEAAVDAGGVAVDGGSHQREEVPFASGQPARQLRARLGQGQRVAQEGHERRDQPGSGPQIAAEAVKRA